MSELERRLDSRTPVERVEHVGTPPGPGAAFVHRQGRVVDRGAGPRRTGAEQREAGSGEAEDADCWPCRPQPGRRMTPSQSNKPGPSRPAARLRSPASAAWCARRLRPRSRRWPGGRRGCGGKARWARTGSHRAPAPPRALPRFTQFARRAGHRCGPGPVEWPASVAIARAAGREAPLVVQRRNPGVASRSPCRRRCTRPYSADHVGGRFGLRRRPAPGGACGPASSRRTSRATARRRWCRRPARAMPQRPMSHVEQAAAGGMGDGTAWFSRRAHATAHPPSGRSRKGSGQLAMSTIASIRLRTLPSALGWAERRTGRRPRHRTPSARPRRP